MAYAAVISLKHTINDLVNSSHVSSTRKILEFAYNETKSLKQVLEIYNDGIGRSSKRLDALDGQIRDYAHKLEDVLQSYEFNSKQEKYEDVEVMQEMTSFAETVRKMEKDYTEELSSPATEEDDDDDDDAAIVDFGMEMVGNSDEFTEIRNKMLCRMRPDDTCIVSFYGECGSGRTVVAKTIYDDLCKGGKQHFECCAWVTVGKKQELKEVLMRIVEQVDNLAAWEYELLCLREDGIVCNYLYKILENRRYMIVLDDVCDVQLFVYLGRSFPDKSNGSLVLVTTSFKEVALLADIFESFEINDVRCFEETMYTVLLIIFQSYYRRYLEPEDAGNKIIANCRCCSISFAKTLVSLFTSDIPVEQWSKIAADKEHPIFIVADEISEVNKIKTDMQFYDIDDETTNLIKHFLPLYVEFTNEIERIKIKMHPGRFFSRMQIISVFGMAGIGKTTFAKNIWNDKSIFCHFDHHVWVTLGPKYRKEEILIDILAQIYPNIDRLHMKGDENLVGELCVQLSCKRCLIVWDDLCDREPLYHLRKLFPEIKGIIMVTTRLAKVGKFAEGSIWVQMDLLNKEQSWCLLREKVFGGGLCSPELEKAGRKIAENCDGLPLLILTVADQLLKAEVSKEFWNAVASGKEKSVFLNAHRQISKTLLPSYLSLPQHLKPCFLYLGVFCLKYEILTSELTDLWNAERFLDPNSPQMVEKCLSELVDASLVMACHKISNFQLKTCRLHSVFWHLSNSQAVKNKFFHAMDCYEDCSIEHVESQRRLCIRNSILLGMKDVQNLLASVASVRSLLCVSPPQQYPVPINFDWRLLSVMDALTIRLYEFPIEVVRLVHLRYLGLTCNGNLPTSISNLWKLQYLIVKRYVHIKLPRNSWPLPVEIWDMKELKHLQVMGGYLPDHKCGSGLQKLLALLDVSVESCREEVLKWIPNLTRLGIRIELAPDDEGNSFHFLNNISLLGRLESLKCVVVNPHIRWEVVPPPAPTMFPQSLKKVSLSGLGYPWEHMSIISKLENLEVLKLKHYAFQGPKWQVDFTDRFEKLKFLLVEDTNLMYWTFVPLANLVLARLCIKNCYKLQELPCVGYIYSVRELKIFDCNPLTVSWAKEIPQTLSACEVTVHSSWLAKTSRQ